MCLKAFQFNRQRRFAQHASFSEAIGTLDGAEAVASLEEKLRESAETHRGSILHRRAYRAVESYRLHSDRTAVSDLLNSLAVVDSTRTESSFTILRVLIWAIPIIGFIGTVVGLGGAVGGFSESLPKATDFSQLKGLLTGVTGGLSVAFDATFVALLISIVLMFPASILEKWELDLLADIDEFCHHEILARIPNTGVKGNGFEANELTAVLKEALRQQQEKFIAWWVAANAEVARSVKSVLDGVVLATGAISGSATALKASIDAAAKQAEGITLNMKTSADHAGNTAECLRIARGEAEGLQGFVHKAAESAMGIQSACDSGKTNASSIAAFLSTARDHANGVESKAATTKQHMVDASVSAQQLQVQVERAMVAARENCAAAAQTQAGELKSRVAVLTHAAEQMKTFVESLAAPGVTNSSGNGLK
jgi:biopolymer transport protein ExbB/TolQ